MAFLTLQQRLEQTAHRPSGFDWMRIGLASAVALFHAFHCSYGAAGVQAPIGFRPAIGLILPMFFALSGFLVAGSLERSRTVVTFLGLRVVRIVPALMVEVVLSALVLGPLVTTDDLRTYASNPAFYTYFLNIVGDIHY